MRNKSTLEKLHGTLGFKDKIEEGYAQIERGEAVIVTMEDMKIRPQTDD